MSADMPKPVAYLTLDSLGHAATCTGPERAAYWRKCGYLVENIFTETQLRECAEAKCAELRAAADGMMKKADELIRRCAVGELMPEDIEELVGSIAAYQSVREPRQ